MAKQSSTPKQTSGGGFLFENKVVAYTLAHLLYRSSPFDPPSGLVEHIAVQKPASEWRLDDLIVTVRSGHEYHRLAFSIKSNKQISQSGFPKDFIRNAWCDLLHESSGDFNEDRDYLGLMATPVGPELRRDVNELLRLARNQKPQSLEEELVLPGRASATMRSLWGSAECPENLASKHDIAEGSAGRLLRRLLWVPLDFEYDHSTHLGQVRDMCRSLLHSGSLDQAEALWSKLQDVADRLRRAAGEINLLDLVDELRGTFHLIDFPDHTADWRKLNEDTQAALRRTKSLIGGSVTLPRKPEHERIDEAFVEFRTVVLLGASGTGKSVIAKVQAQLAQERGRAFWLDANRAAARTFTEWRSHLGLSHPMGELFRTVPVSNALLILDGLDRLHAAEDFATIGEFLDVLRFDEKTSPWCVLITCTPEDWDRVSAELLSLGCLPSSLPTIEIEAPHIDELERVWSKFPKLKPLRIRHHLASILLRPKVLDLLATYATQDDDLSVVGESDLVRWFWDREIATGERATLRAKAAHQVAELLADKLVPDVSMSAIPHDVQSDGLCELLRDRMLTRVDGRIAFDHDLYADWTRALQLVAEDEAGRLVDFLSSRLSSPTWHRALRVFGILLLEKSDSISRWKSVFASLSELSETGGPLAQDILLEAVIFAETSGNLLEDLWDSLSNTNGRLLVRLLNRFFHTATIPHRDAINAITEQAPELELQAAATARIPYIFYWPRLLSLLAEHREEIPLQARGLAAQVAEQWLLFTEIEWPLREKAAYLATTLAEARLREKEATKNLFLDCESDRKIYQAVLASGHERPDAVTQIVLEAAGRRDQRFAPPEESEEERAERLANLPTRSIARVSYAPRPEPWAHGPVFRVDGALEKVILEGYGLRSLADSLPDAARETLLAMLIPEPRRRTNKWAEKALTWLDWYPPFYTHGPFRAFLATAESEAVQAILELVAHATECWIKARARYIAQEEGCAPEQIEPPTVSITVSGAEREFYGDRGVFKWIEHGPDGGGVISSALIALEKHLYDRADQGDDVEPLILRILNDSRSLATVGLLSIFGRRYPQYLYGILKGLLFNVNLLRWSLSDVKNTGHGWSGLVLYPLPKSLHSEFQDWQQMPHRRKYLQMYLQAALLLDEKMRPEIEQFKQDLERSVEPGGQYEGWDFVEGLIAQLERANYEEVEDNQGRVEYRYIPPAKFQDDIARSEERLRVSASLMTLSSRSLDMLEDKEGVTEAALDELWNSAQLLDQANLPKDDYLPPPTDDMAGVAAVFVIRGEEWLEEHPERAAWAKQILLEAATEEREDDRWYRRTDRRGFAARGLPTIWARHPEDPELRGAIARLALQASPDQVGLLTAGVSVRREVLGDDHLRLLNAIFLRASLEWRLREAQSGLLWDADEKDVAEAEKRSEKIQKALDTIERDLGSADLDASIPRLEDIAPLPQRNESWVPQRSNRRSAPVRSLSQPLLGAAYRGIPNLDNNEADIWLRVWEELVTDIILPLQPDHGENLDLDEPPEDAERYFLSAVADVVASAPEPTDVESLWQPIIKLGVCASHWVSWFARQWARFALYEEARDSVIQTWMAMIEVAHESPRWEAGDGYTANAHRAGELWRNLLGLDHFDGDSWSSTLRPRVGQLQAQLARWAETHLINPDNARAFARFLTFPAVVDLHFDGLIWLARAARNQPSRYWEQQHGSTSLEDSIMDLLQYTWTKRRSEIRRNQPAFSAFRDLLQILVSRQFPPALVLAERVSSGR